MWLESTTVCKSRRTSRAWIRLLSRMTPYVTLQPTGMGELLEAVVTRVRPMTSMDAHVNVQAAIRTEVFLAVFTFVLLFLGLFRRFIVCTLSSFFVDVRCSVSSVTKTLSAFKLTILKSAKVRLFGLIHAWSVLAVRTVCQYQVIAQFTVSLIIFRQTLRPHSYVATLLETAQYSRCIMLL